MHERELGERNFVAGQTCGYELPRNYSLDRLKFRLTATLSREVGVAAGAPMDLSGAQLIKRIEVRKNGREVLKAFDAETLMRLNEIRYGTPPHISFTDTWDGFDVQSEIPFILDFQIDFGMWRALQRFDTLLDTTWRGGITTLDLVITWGQLNDVMTTAYDPAGAGVSADVTPVVSVAAEEYIDPDAVPGEYAENREYGIRKVITATDPKMQHKFNIGNRFRSFVLKTYADGVQRNDILNNVKIMTGSNVLKNRVALALREENKLHLGLETMPAGYYLLEFCPDGHLTRAINTLGMSDLTCEMDVAKQGTLCTVEIFPVELVKVPVTVVA